MLWEQGEQAGSKGSKLEGKVPGTQECSGSKGSKLGARRASWGLPEAPGRFQGSRDALGAKGASLEQGKQAGSKGSKLGAS